MPDYDNFAQSDNRVQEPGRFPVSGSLRNNVSAARSPYFLIILFALLASGIVITGYIYYRNYEKQYRNEVAAQLSAIADLKVGELVKWRKERLSDAAITFKNRAFSDSARKYLENPADSQDREILLTWLRHLEANNEYDRVLLLDSAGIERLSIPDTSEPVEPQIKDDLLKGRELGQVIFRDFYRDALDKPIHLSVLIPIQEESNGSRTIGFLVLRIDPQKYLYPFVGRWLTSSKSAETLLVRRDGNDALFLNTLLFNKDAALNLRIPLNRREVPAVKAVLGEQGIIEGRDYRGAPVIADVRAIPDSPWFIVTRIDKSEVYAPLRERLLGLIILIGALLLGAGAGVGLVWRRQSVQYYREKFEAAVVLHESEERYRATLMSVGDGVIATDADGRVSTLNPVAVALTGWPLEEARGKSLEEVFNIINEQTRQKIENPVSKVIRDGMVIGLANHTTLIARDGTERPIADSGAPIRNAKGEITGVVLVFRDQTEERTAQKAMEESEKRFRSFFELTADLACIADIKGYFRELNPAWEKVLDYSIQELMGKSLLDSVYPEDKDKTFHIIKNKLERGDVVSSFENRYVRKDGGIVWLEWTARPSVEDGRIFAVARDITDRKRAEEAKEKAELELEKQRALSVQSDRLRALGEMATGIAHELNQPLLGIRGLSEHILLGMERGWYQEQKEIQDKSKIILEQVDRISHIIEHVRGFARSSNDASVSPVQVNDVVRSGTDLMGAQLRSRGLILETNLADDLPLVNANPFSLEEVLFNLLSNGRDAMIEKMEREKIENPLISISTYLEENDSKKNVVIKVEDQGSGIPQDVIDKIFDPFFTTKELGKGTGVGLPICKSIVEAIGGAIVIQSQPGVGTTAIVRLPAIEEQATRA